MKEMSEVLDFSAQIMGLVSYTLYICISYDLY